MKTIGIVPARMAASRFPGKPLHPIAGKPMVEHVFARARLSWDWDVLCIATCDRRIMDFAEQNGFPAVMTADTHTRALDRVAEAYGHVVDAPDDDDIVVTYSHFLPRPELYRGYANLWNVMGSPRIADDARRWSSSAHVFGHSHLNVDAVIHGVRYVQHALGYPHERWIGANEPKKIVSASVAA